MARPLTVIHCKKIVKACVVCGQELMDASMKGHFICSNNECDSKITSRAMQAVSGKIKEVFRVQSYGVAYPVCYAASDSLFVPNESPVSAKYTQIWYSDEYNLPMVRVPGKYLGHKNDPNFKIDAAHHYIYGTDRQIVLYQLPAMHCGTSMFIANGKVPVTWADICNQEHNEPDISWKIGNVFANPVRFFSEAMIEKILGSIAGGKSAFHIPPEELHQQIYSGSIPKDKLNALDTQKQICLLQSDIASETAILEVLGK